MFVEICLGISICLNIRLAYCLGKHYKWTKCKGCKLGYKCCSQEENNLSLNCENKILDKDK